MASAGVLLVSAACWPGLPGCSSAAGRRQQLASGNPLDRARGAVEAAEARDAAAAPWLVDLLEDSDEAVRMVAIRALRQLLGTDLGYRYYAGESERALAVARWREALRAGAREVGPTTRATGAAPAPATAPAGPGGTAGDVAEGTGAGTQ
jgi:hypothetical protein